MSSIGKKDLLSSIIQANEVDEQEFYFISRRLSIFYSLSITELGKKDLVKLIGQIGYSDSNPDQLAEAIIKEITGGEKKVISTSDIIIQMIKRKKDDKKSDPVSVFYEKLAFSLLTKSEGIIIRLKKLQNQPWIKDSKDLAPYLSRIILTITEGDLYDLDTDDVLNHLKGEIRESKVLAPGNTEKSPEEPQKKDEGIAFLAKYSKIENTAQREKDFQIIRKLSKKYVSTFNYSSLHSTNSLEKSKKRRSTNLNSIISPSIIARLQTQMANIDTLSFDIFDLDEIVGKKTTVYLAHDILSKFDIVEQEVIPPEILKNFIEEIVGGYDRTHAIYHNDLHAGDVMQTLFTFFIKGNLQERMQLGQLDTFAIIVAGLCHDFKHPGQNNLFHINSKSKIAMRYNDISVLENYHVAQSFKVINRSRTNIYKNFTPEEYRICRRRMIEGILSTDMANHQTVLGGIKAKVASFNIVKGENFEKIFEVQKGGLSKLFEAQQSILNMLIHSADISNPAKPDKISENWTKRVYDEFFIQGDEERKLGLPISNFCDRTTTNINKAMIGFINFVVLPTFELLTNLIWETVDFRDYCKANLKKYMNNVKKEERANTLQKKK